METNKFNYDSIRSLCERYRDEIKAQEDLAYVLNQRKVRYVTRQGLIRYTQFGDFYINDNGVMMIIPDDAYYARMHQPDRYDDCLFNTVPVIYGGVQTYYKDDQGQEIYTGDVVLANDELTAMVEYFSEQTEPSLRLDNHNFPLAECHTLYTVGSILHSLTEEMFHRFDQYELRQHNPVYQWRVTKKQMREDIRLIKHAPTFASEYRYELPPRIRKTYIKEEALKLCPEDVLIAFCCAGGEDSERELYVDLHSVAEGMHVQAIELDHPVNWEGVERDIHETLLIAHRNPGTRFIVCDLPKHFLKPGDYNRLVRLFTPVYSYHLHNVVVPFHFYDIMYEQ